MEEKAATIAEYLGVLKLEALNRAFSGSSGGLPGTFPESLWRKSNTASGLENLTSNWTCCVACCAEAPNETNIARGQRIILPIVRRAGKEKSDANAGVMRKSPCTEAQ